MIDLRTDRVTEDRQASLRSILVPSWRCVARRVPSRGTLGSTRQPEAAGQARISGRDATGRLAGGGREPAVILLKL
eukprot:COSAG06_NODE_4163_length_4509_cov_7.424490_2_plen_76_part_00